MQKGGIMLNYIKSELYRAFHSKEIHETAIVLTVLVFLMNLILRLFSSMDHFRYGITSFSYSMLVAGPMIYCYGAGDVAVMLYEADNRNGTRGNSIACGISRIEIFAGKCIVSLLTSLGILLIVMPVYIASAVLLLPKEGPVEIKDLLLEIPAVSLVAAAALILAIVLLEVYDKVLVSILIWLGLLVFIPKALLLAGMYLSDQSAILLNIARWLPANFFSVEMQVTMSECITIWSTPEGMAKCVISGVLGILIFSIAGVLSLRKRDI